MSGDSLERIDHELTIEGARMLAREKTRQEHTDFLRQIDARLAALGHTWDDLVSLWDVSGEFGAGRGEVASG